MSTTVFPFTLLRPYKERRVHDTTLYEIASGVTLRRAEYTVGLLAVEASLRLPYGGQTAADWDSFLATHKGGYEEFLYKALRWRTSTAEALGTGNGTTVAFALDYRYVDASTLLVYKAGVLQTLSTHYTFGGNNSAPVVTFLSAPTAGQAITATYDYYHPVRLAEGGDDPDTEHLHDTGSDSTRIVQVRRIALLETAPGAHLV